MTELTANADQAPEGFDLSPEALGQPFTAGIVARDDPPELDGDPVDGVDGSAPDDAEITDHDGDTLGDI